jgi:tyrosyl-tRNA synthetase
MSKSLGNYVGIAESPDDMFGKLMSVSDDLMWRYFDLLSFRSVEALKSLRQEVADGANPRDIKFQLAQELVGRFHDDLAAEAAKDTFIRRFKDKEIPDEIVEVTVQSENGELGLAHLLRQAQLVTSNSEAFRMIEQGAVRIDGQRIEDRAATLPAGSTHVFQVGKRRFARVTVT